MHLLSGVYASLLLATAALANGNSRFFRRSAEAGYELKKGPLDTPWTDQVGLNPWPDYPRPQLQRPQWKSLNGVWRYENADSKDAVNSPPFGTNLTQSVLVPFCLESALSGIMGNYTINSWYQTTFEVPSSWSGDRVILNFEAVDNEATVFVNKQKVGFHKGGYFSFSLDVTDYLVANGTNEMLVFAYDPTDSDAHNQIPIGKQTLRPSHIFYTPCSGIWQSVWLESVPASYITKLDLSADMHGKVNVTVHSSGNSSSPVEITFYEPKSDKVKGSAKFNSGSPFVFTVEDVRLWSPDEPVLYDITVKMGSDTVKSYTGFRSFGKANVHGIMRPTLNGESIFVFGPLDQGYWPDGLYTPPTKQAMISDLHMLKNVSFNMVRKHIKVEPALFYEACDRIGLLVMQDMPSMQTQVMNPNDTKACPDDFVPVAYESSQVEFERELALMIEQLKSYTSIFAWVIYNEGWGQERRGQPSYRLTDMVKSLDPTRLVNSVTGWHDEGAGDFHDNHHYANPQCGTPFYSIQSTPYDPKRIGFQGEFGGLGHNTTQEHLWKMPDAIAKINETYELDLDLRVWNYRAHRFLDELREQTELFACSGGVYTQTTDVEGEVNGLATYDRRLVRMNTEMWRGDIEGMYKALEDRDRGQEKRREWSAVEDAFEPRGTENPWIRGEL
ncbi:hypothetical protein GQ43DRAFT_364855 [Delitschia confertaspora ATCC 74209]|uniref:Beta-galactosidase n=1 Tax=Delitschia confertaspora ATCC 74209 TaxID=1513339 RepID=A0A9P4N1Z7_9PLEO|nr:hypothetical protein GQ43DRAFT_364855 [Delitschia confertaspora ATCC 74209]